MLFTRTRVVLAATISVGVAVVPTIGQGHVVKLKSATTVGVGTGTGCLEIFKVADYQKYANSVYNRKKVSYRAHRRLDRMHRCQHSWRARKRVGTLHKKFKTEREQRQIISSLTPYACTHGNYAIPCFILKCESRGGEWDAANDSGAIGPYQFLGWPVPWPVRSEADKLAHHRMAARLWRGGAGAGHWAQCLR